MLFVHVFRSNRFCYILVCTTVSYCYCVFCYEIIVSSVVFFYILQSVLTHICFGDEVGDPDTHTPHLTWYLLRSADVNVPPVSFFPPQLEWTLLLCYSFSALIACTFCSTIFSCHGISCCPVPRRNKREQVVFLVHFWLGSPVVFVTGRKLGSRPSV